MVRFMFVVVLVPLSSDRTEVSGIESTRTPRLLRCVILRKLGSMGGYYCVIVTFYFVVQKSSADSSRVSRFAGLYGETCYCLITDHHTGMLWGNTFNSKEPPIDFLNRWLVRHGLPKDSMGKNGLGKYVCFDTGGDLGKSSAVISLFEEAGYQIEPNAPADSSSNGLGERPHRTIKDAMRAMLSGTGLDAKFWPFAFRHFLYLYNLTPHAGRPSSPYTMRTGKKADLSHLRVFGCQVTVRDVPDGALGERSHAAPSLVFAPPSVKFSTGMITPNVSRQRDTLSLMRPNLLLRPNRPMRSYCSAFAKVTIPRPSLMRKSMYRISKSP